MLSVDPEAPKPRLQVIAYGPEELTEREDIQVSDISALRAKAPVIWVNVDGLGDEAILRQLGELFDLHRLALEDVVNVHQRPKVERYGEVYFIVVRMPRGSDPLETEQVSLFLGKGFVLTFQEQVGDCLDPVRQRIRQKGPRLRNGGADYLAYALIDALTDAYFPLLEHYAEILERIEDDVLQHPEQTTISRLHQAKRDLMSLRREIWPLRELLSTLTREETPLIGDSTRLYLRDCYDHAIQLLELVESSRDLASGLMDLYLSSLSNRMNEVMKVLTIIATIFIPLSFIAGLYGMNFNTARSRWNMPELDWPFGYPLALGLMAVVALGLLVYFRRRGWLGDGKKPPPRAEADAKGLPSAHDSSTLSS